MHLSTTPDLPGILIITRNPLVASATVVNGTDLLFNALERIVPDHVVLTIHNTD